MIRTKLMIKQCSKHGETKFRNEKGNSWRCCKCRSEAVQRRRDKVKDMGVQHHGGKCAICNYSKCSAALEFHHKDPTQKDFGISAKGYTRSWDKIKAELDKCVLLCSNCHRELHSGQIERLPWGSNPPNAN